jgi:ribosomal protein L17
MSNYNWLEDRIDTTGVKLYNFREKAIQTITLQSGTTLPTRLQMFNQLQKTVELRNELNEVVENLEKLLDGGK